MNRVVFASNRLFRLLVAMTAASAGMIGVAAGVGAAEPTRGDVRRQLDRLAAGYNIEVVSVRPDFPVKTRYGAITGKAASRFQVRKYAPLFTAEFALYPREFVKASRLKRVVFCTELAFAGQRRSAIPDFQHDTLYLDVGRAANDRTYLRKVLHHEFFHIVDYRDDGRLYRDDRWKALNPANVKYGRGGKNAQNNSQTSVLTTRYPGFLNHYSTTGVEEDKAELFANMIVMPAYVAARAAKDRVLAAKVRQMKSLLKAFCRQMNPEFWKKIEVVKRPR